MVESEDDEHSRGRVGVPWSICAGSISVTPRTRQSSPEPSIAGTRVFGDARTEGRWRFWQVIGGLILGSDTMRKKMHPRKRRIWGMVAIFGLIAFFLSMNWWFLSGVEDEDRLVVPVLPFEGEWKKFIKGKDHQRFMYPRLLALAAHALAEGVESHEPEDLWQETFLSSSAWKPCSDKDDWKYCEQTNGYIMVSANGGINQQRVAVCNAVAVAHLLNATLVVPKFLFNSVWRDESKFADIYQEEFFINYLKDDIKIVRELPEELQSLDLQAIGSTVFGWLI